MDIPAFVSTRAAVGVLADRGHTQRMARRLLAAGLAGEPLVAGGTVSYEAARVLELAAREEVSRAEVDRACPMGLFVARRTADVAGPWDFSIFTGIRLRLGIEACGYFPLVVALSGVVVHGASITRTRRTGGTYLLDLEPPGAWFETFRGRRCSTGPGRPWALHLPTQPRVGESAA